MSFLLNFNWISLLALAIAVLVFVFLTVISRKIGWTFVILLALAFGAGFGILFASENNSYLVWTDLLGSIYINVIKALVAPVILLSIVSGFISLRDGNKIKRIGVKSVGWLLLSSAAAIILSIVAGVVIFPLVKGAGSVFSGIGSVSDATVNAYKSLTSSVDQVILNLFPSNVVSDLASNNVVAIIIIAVALALGYLAVAKEEGKEKVAAFKDIVEAAKKIVYKILSFVIDLTPYAVFCLIAGSASAIFTNINTIVNLLVLLAVIYLVALIHTYGYNALVLKFVAKLNPFAFFRKTARAQATAFTTQSSVGTLPITIGDLRNKVGVDEEVANFTAPLGTTIGMPGCTCVWPVLLAVFYVNAVQLNWGVGEYVILAIVSLLLSVGSAGVPGIALVSSIALFGVLGLPVAAVVILIPINTISDMVRTLDNVTSAATATAVVARKTDNLNDEIFKSAEGAKKEAAV